VIIYCVENIISGKKYIGKSKNSLQERMKSHFFKIRNGVKTKFYDAIRSYGIDNFKYYILDQAFTADELNEKEIKYIKLFDTINSGYNMVEGGTGGDTMCHHPNKEEIYKKIGKKCSIALKGRIFTEEHRLNMSKSRVGHKWTLEQRQKLSNSIKGENHPLFGKFHSEETKRKIGLSSKIKHKRICLTCNTEFYGGRSAKYCQCKCKPLALVI